MQLDINNVEIMRPEALAPNEVDSTRGQHEGICHLPPLYT
jgi:hypothetical protein